MNFNERLKKYRHQLIERMDNDGKNYQGISVLIVNNENTEMIKRSKPDF